MFIILSMLLQDPYTLEKSGSSLIFVNVNNITHIGVSEKGSTFVTFVNGKFIQVVEKFDEVCRRINKLSDFSKSRED